jgi:hypothetical protein
MKKDFTPLVSGSLELVKQLRPGTFKYLSVNEVPPDGDVHTGLLAQEVLPLLPNLVRAGMKTPLTPDGLLRIDYVEMVPFLIAAIQELSNEVDKLKG